MASKHKKKETSVFEISTRLKEMCSSEMKNEV
jgi:hypothetical protein